MAQPIRSILTKPFTLPNGHTACSCDDCATWKANRKLTLEAQRRNGILSVDPLDRIIAAGLL